MLKKGFSAFVVLLTIVHIDLFVIALLYLHYIGMSFNDTAVTCFFTFWSVEILALAGIKIGKTRYKYKSYEDNLEEKMGTPLEEDY